MASATAPSMGTRYAELVVHSSVIAGVGAPATMKAASILPSFSASAESAKLWYCALMSVSARPAAARTSVALKYTPEPGAPMETLLPFRSATLLMLGSMVTS